MTTQAIIELKENRNLEVIESLGASGSPQFLIKEFNFENFTVQVVKSQWTKSQKTYGIRVLNMETGKNPHVQICNYSKKQALDCVKQASENGFLHLWTGHIAKVGELLS